MVSFGEKAKIKKAGNLNQGRSYVITTVPEMEDYLFLLVKLHHQFGSGQLRHQQLGQNI